MKVKDFERWDMIHFSDTSVFVWHLEFLDPERKKYLFEKDVKRVWMDKQGRRHLDVYK